jgi:hypothetical protein
MVTEQESQTAVATLAEIHPELITRPEGAAWS